MSAPAFAPPALSPLSAAPATSGAARLDHGLAAPDPLRKAAEAFEAVFLSSFISQMWAGIPVDGPFGGGHAEATYRSFLADEYGAALSRQGGIGIADEVYADLLRIQEEHTP